MAVIRQEKVDAVEDVKQRVQASNAVFFVNFRGLDVSSVTALRKSLREAESEALVCKNTLARIALKDLEISYPDEFLKGPSLLVQTSSDVAKTSKALVNFAKDNEALEIKGGILEKDRVLTLDDVQALSKLPSREELIAKLVGTMKAPITNLHGALSGPIRGLAYALKAVQDKNQEV